MNAEYADIIVDISHEKVDRPFQYRIPERLRGTLEVGMCVQVPFGNGNKLIQGFVTEIEQECRFDPERIKEIHSIVHGQAMVESRMIQLAAWIKRNYGGTMIQAMKTVIPAKKTVKKLEHRRIERCVSKEETIACLGEAQRRKQTAKARLLQELVTEKSIPYEWVTGKLGVSGATVKSLENAGIVRVVVESSYRNPVKADGILEKEKVLSSQQQRIVTEVLQDYDAGRRETYLIHGITGSGKTEVYMALIEEVVARGRQAIMLIPEIALTYQTLLRFYHRFGDRVSVMNSSLSPGEKYDQCQRAKNGEIDIIIGPRSALFTPFPDVGIIVMDEEHEGSYKSESCPKYHARETAQEVARMYGASLVLGSATPSMEAYYRVETGEYKLFRLTERLTGGCLPQVYIADLREELRKGNRSIFSIRLQELLADRLEKGEQSMLFLNRRGYAGFISCRACGYVMKCPHCDVSLSEHQGGRLVCHYCGYSQAAVQSCPKCGSRYISGFRAGTQQIEERLTAMFPKARVLRMDADTTRTKDSYEKILSAFANGEADVLIGTQMIVKGHDFPRVTLVGVLAADLSLAAGDYRSGERTFQLLTQAAGRAGRGSVPGEVVIQTYQPEHYAVVQAAKQDYEAFYKEEILYRELMGYPPVANMMAVQIYAREEKAGMELAKRLAGEAGKLAQMTRQPTEAERQSGAAAGQPANAVGYPGKRMAILGPAPASIGRINDIFRFVFYVKYANYDTLIQVKDILEKKLQEWQPRYESVQFDFNPVNTL